ncbi:hypothetical protein OPV22_020571 [Ensete ventricosum]|uniref:Uncharacterized protein n=1 Tax=Ensete ventricosum TaxID=4639 RepID=A0AAV8QQ43_ENSVE|nr:hypothetical protein OPV22_020571 [Ensete ventricosum]
MLTTFNEVDMTNMLKLQSEYKDDAFVEKHGVKLGLTSGFVKAALFLDSQTSMRLSRGIDVIYRDCVCISQYSCWNTQVEFLALKECSIKIGEDGRVINS